MAIIFFVIHFGGQLNIGGTAVLPPSSGSNKASAEFRLITSSTDFRAELHKALLQSGTVIAVSVPLLRAFRARSEYDSDDYALNIDKALEARLSMIEDELQSIQNPPKPTVIVATPESIYQTLLSNNKTNSRTAFPGLYSAKLKEFGKLVLLKPTADLLTDGSAAVDIAFKTQTSVVSSCWQVGEYNDISKPYIDFYYPNVIEKALASFKRSDPTYLHLQEEVVVLESLPTAQQNRYYRNYDLPSDSSILQSFWFSTTDPFLQKELLGSRFLAILNGTTQPIGASQ